MDIGVADQPAPVPKVRSVRDELPKHLVEGLQNHFSNVFVRQTISLQHRVMVPADLKPEDLEKFLDSPAGAATIKNVPNSSAAARPTRTREQRLNPDGEETISLEITMSEQRNYSATYSVTATGRETFDVPISIAAEGAQAVRDWLYDHDLLSSIDLGEGDGDYNLGDGGCDYGTTDEEYVPSLRTLEERAQAILDAREAREANQ